LALRGDKPREETPQTAGGPLFSHAVDLIKYIQQCYGDYFDIGVAGYPEGHPESPDIVTDIQYLKQKIDAGATFVITQMFYDVHNFLDWVTQCRAAGIHVPIIPGIMPITNWTTLLRRTRLMQTRIPPHFLRILEPIKDDDAAVRDVGTKLVADLCRKILESGILQLHFYTMNLEKATFMILEKLEMTTAMNLKNPLPWRQVLLDT
jgi:methylenetetrahydrofolate reductase (NADPH)